MSAYKIYPPLGIARVGNAPTKFYVGPENYRGLPTNPDGSDFQETDFRDENGLLCRQAARFHIYGESGDEITLDTKLDGKSVRNIEWTVHIANKKASWYEFATNKGEHGYASNHPLRNSNVKGDDRLGLIIDPGPRSIDGTDKGPVHMDKDSIPDDYQGGHFPDGILNPTKESIDTLGELHTDGQGRLLVLGGLGISGSTKDPAVIGNYANNDDWWDDTSDGPVSAVITWDDDTTDVVETAWVSVGPPSYVPEIPNLVTLWDTIFDSAVREGHFPDINDHGMWRSGADGYKPNFQSEIQPLLERGTLYPWVAAIPPKPHEFDMDLLGTIPKKSDPNNGLRKWILDVLRPPGSENVIVSKKGATMMPYLAGDNCLIGDTLTANYLRLTDTQYFFLQQWADGHFINEPPSSSEPEAITRAALDNCVGGAFSPGIEATWISRNRTIYRSDDPLRLNAASLMNGPLSLDFNPQAMEPGDLTRYMALPWQADFNQCSSQPIDGRVLWWWPPQRPEFVYLKPETETQSTDTLLSDGTPMPDKNTGGQVAWVGTDFDQRRDDFLIFSDNVDMVKHWSELGFVMEQEIEIEGERENRYVEVQRILCRPFFRSSDDD